jgi:uncharacterized protein YhaN
MSEESKVSIGSVGGDLSGNVAGDNIIHIQDSFSELYKAAGNDPAINQLLAQLQHTVLNQDEPKAMNLGAVLRDKAPDIFAAALGTLPWLAKLFGRPG